MATQQDKGPIYEIIEREAARSDIPKGDFLRFAYIETGGKFDPNAHNQGSGARGLFQFVPGTAAEFGLTGREFDASANTEAAARLYDRNMNQIKRRSAETGRAYLSGEELPNGLDMYLAHQQGGGGYASIQQAIDTGAFSLASTRGNIMGNISRSDFEQVTGNAYSALANMGDQELASSFVEYWQSKYAAISIPERGIYPSTVTHGAPQEPTADADGVLERGERGAEVTALQQSLNTLGFRSADGAALEAQSGVYGARTSEAVKAFQEANGLDASGKADQRTQEAITQQLGLAEQQRNAVPQSPRGQEDSGSDGIRWPTPGNTRINEADKAGEGRGEFGTSRRRSDGSRYGHQGLDIQGNVGDPVIAMAGGVIRIIPDHARAGNMAVIDHGGGLTSRYLHLDGFSVRDGVRVEAGQQIGTMGRTGNTPRSGDTHLHFEVRQGGRPVDPLPYLQGTGRGVTGDSQIQEPNGVLRMGAAGDTVRQIQQHLNQLGYRGADGKPLEVASSVFGVNTEHALRAFQADKGLRVDGVFGSESRGALAAMTSALREGLRGPEVQRLQEQLNLLGFKGADGKPLETVSGVFGPQTVHALRAFQADRGISVDGVFGSESRVALATELERPASPALQSSPTSEPVQKGASSEARAFVDRLLSAVQEGGQQVRGVLEEKLNQMASHGWGKGGESSQQPPSQEAPVKPTSGSEQGR